ncbi:MAG: hypothetical protein N5P05_003348 [Chroococcopsis gigantea SAG 12.99]|jgi:hypothetical protein|nr:chlororespiratory reduction protein 7 [Chlorogloea purpurea SAG 13.99]MDV3001742.1 hypothetical protein [Chroococcopsis gigantea SAG 12.99]
MPDSIMYQEDYFVVLEAHQPEQFLNHEELSLKLQDVIQNQLETLPCELQGISGIDRQAVYLKDNFCQIELKDGNYLQWYVTRLEK